MPFLTDRITRLGGRQHNEDACGDLWLGNAGCWAVADGLGGHRGGETASNLAVQAVLASFQSNPEFSAVALQQHLEAAQQALLKVQKEQPGLASMRTTIVVLITDSRQALWAHVGDSRLYCLDAGRIAFCTKDHSVVQAMVSAGELSARDIRHHEDRNRLLRALGNPNGDFRPEIAPKGRTFYKGTAFLLCTDGFWENVSESEMEIDLAKADSPGDWLGKMETRLMERITADSDNYTATAVFVDSETPAPKVMEDREMKGSFGTGLGTTFVLAGIMLIALVAVGVWDWLLLRQVKQATDNQTQVLRQLQAQQQVPSDLIPRLISGLSSLDRLCSDTKLKPVCAGTPQAANAGPAAATDTAPDPKSKAGRVKKAK
ncbi:MAG TPA: protein phosphatase 2C domain-containing protein [Terriglobia bacterium]|nr:protein phosphatase 2C domain-containing protein [Terriglobia bacterium]